MPRPVDICVGTKEWLGCGLPKPLVNLAMALCESCNHARIRDKKRRERGVVTHAISQAERSRIKKKRRAYFNILQWLDDLECDQDSINTIKMIIRPFVREIEKDLADDGDLDFDEPAEKIIAHPLDGHDDDYEPSPKSESASLLPLANENENQWQQATEPPKRGTPRLNPDGVSVKGCSIIYASGGQAGEYAPLTANPYSGVDGGPAGCGHKCSYCYVPKLPMMHNSSRREFDAGAVPKKDYLERLEKDARKYQALGITEQVMLSFTSDPYHPGDTALTRDVLQMIQRYGMGICTLTKGGTRALRDLDLFRRGRDAFACTLTSLNDDFSLLWERNAPLPADRINALRTFHEAGIYTWVSLEPVLDTAATLEIIRQTHKFVDLFKVGRVNYIGLTKTTNWRQFTADVLEVLDQTGAKAYIKKDLQPYLPEGYKNNMRVQQFKADPFQMV
jgi:DNA repair photolyase